MSIGCGVGLPSLYRAPHVNSKLATFLRIRFFRLRRVMVHPYFPLDLLGHFCDRRQGAPGIKESSPDVPCRSSSITQDRMVQVDRQGALTFPPWMSLSSCSARDPPPRGFSVENVLNCASTTNGMRDPVEYNVHHAAPAPPPPCAGAGAERTPRAGERPQRSPLRPPDEVAGNLGEGWRPRRGLPRRRGGRGQPPPALIG